MPYVIASGGDVRLRGRDVIVDFDGDERVIFPVGAFEGQLSLGALPIPGEASHWPLAVLTDRVQASLEKDFEVDFLGCMLREGTPGDFSEPFEPVFFAGENNAVVIVDGIPLVLSTAPGGREIDYGATTRYESQDYTAELVEIGQPQDTSIESNDRTATLRVTPRGSSVIVFEGVLGCGV